MASTISLKRIVSNILAEYIAANIPELAGKITTTVAGPQTVAPCLALVIMADRMSFEAADGDEVYENEDFDDGKVVVEVGLFSGNITMELYTVHPFERETYQQKILDLFLASEWSPGTLRLLTPNLVVNGYASLYQAEAGFFLQSEDWSDEMSFEAKRYAFLELEVEYPALTAYNAANLTELTVVLETNDDPDLTQLEEVRSTEVVRQRPFLYANSPDLPPVVTPPTIAVVGALANANSASSLTPTMPAHQVDDILVVVLAGLGNNNYTLSTANGFVEMANSPQHNQSDINSARLHVWWKRATSNAESSPVIADIALDDAKAALIIVVRGCKTSGNPWDVTAGSTAVQSTAASAPGITTTIAQTLVVAIVATRIDALTAQFSGWTNPSLTGFVEIADAATNTGAGASIGAAAGSCAVAGAVSTTAATLATASTTASMTVAFAPL